MNTLDAAGVALLAAAMLRGMVRGFGREMRGLGGILVAVLVALKARVPLGAWLAARVGAQVPLWIWEAAAFLVLMLLVSGLVAAATARVGERPTSQGAVLADVTGGGVVGLVEGWLLFSAGVALLLQWSGPELVGLLGGSDLARLAFRFLPALHRFLSGSNVL
ncbi:CvpA family protein [Limnochorda pilosa]|uniref:Colicin V production protein n=1 Tax=Limnochorda pilosa TaxID=1555112 RepID=A0A0K2SMJ0_LIMPI|nr:CvpA family protein [Limnochorda pilosa]BAS28331.1 hypothetical protein LIP_2495 [Limnochorda pilosa]